MTDNKKTGFLRTQTKEDASDPKRLALQLAFLVTIALLVFGGIRLLHRDAEPGRATARAPSAAKQATQAWYEGGTLHDATIREWKRATYRDRLATCADLVAAIAKHEGRRPKDMDEFREWAAALEICISEASRDEWSDHLKVTEVSAACWILMDT